jgi:hypothetical protein
MQKNNADIIQLAYISWLKGSIAFSCLLSHAEFLSLIDPSNIVGQLILSHLVAIQSMMAPINQDERALRKASIFLKGMVRWLELLHSNIDPGMKSYFEWPIKMAERGRAWLQYEKVLAK